MDKDIEYKLDIVDSYGDGEKFHCILKLPMNLGWYNDVNIKFDENGKFINYPLKHKNNDLFFAYFEGDFYLKNKSDLPLFI